MADNTSLIQEHWLQTSELRKIETTDNDCLSVLAVSSMDDKVSTDIMHDRLFGGTGILWCKSLFVNVRLVHKSANGRSITVCLIKCYLCVPSVSGF